MSAEPGQAGQPAQSPRPTTPPQTPNGGTAVSPSSEVINPIPPQLEAKTPWTAYIKPILWTIVAIYVITFVFLNREIVVINFIFFQASVPLIFVLVGLALIGAALCAGVMIMTRRRATKKLEAKALSESKKK